MYKWHPIILGFADAPWFFNNFSQRWISVEAWLLLINCKILWWYQIWHFERSVLFWFFFLKRHLTSFAETENALRHVTKNTGYYLFFLVGMIGLQWFFIGISSKNLKIFIYSCLYNAALYLPVSMPNRIGD